MVLKTERLTIRRIMTGDWESIQRIWNDQKKSVYACYDKPNDTRSEAVRKRVAKWASFEMSMEHMFYSVCLDDITIGYITLNQRSDGYEIGYCFLSTYQGNGYAKESISELITAIQKLQSSIVITARTALKNIPSVKLLQSLGFKIIGTEKVSFYQDDEGKDIYFEGGIFELTIHSAINFNISFD